MTSISFDHERTHIDQWVLPAGNPTEQYAHIVGVLADPSWASAFARYRELLTLFRQCYPNFVEPDPVVVSVTTVTAPPPEAVS